VVDRAAGRSGVAHYSSSSSPAYVIGRGQIDRAFRANRCAASHRQGVVRDTALIAWCMPAPALIVDRYADYVMQTLDQGMDSARDMLHPAWRNC
jgi:hypothetical protein